MKPNTTTTTTSTTTTTQVAPNMEDSSDSGARDCDGVSDSSDPDLESDEDVKSFEMVDNSGMLVPKCEKNDSSEECDDFTLVNRSSPGLSRSFSAMKTGDDRLLKRCPKGRQGNRSKPYSHAKEDVKETMVTAVPATGHLIQGSVKWQLGADTLPASAQQEVSAKLQLTAEHVKQESKPVTSVDFYDVHKKLREFVNSVLSVDNLAGTFQCCTDAIKLRKVAMIMTDSHQLHKFFMVFSHSVSCANDDCSNTCRMFRRIRGHVSSARHPCALMHVYSQILRMHIDTCVDDDCGLVTCKSMLAIRQLDNFSVLPRHFKKLELLIAQKTAASKGAVNKAAGVAVRTHSSENKENIDAAAAAGSGANVSNNTTTILAGAASDKALDLSKTAKGPHFTYPLAAQG